jgi:hypothetical protein
MAKLLLTPENQIQRLNKLLHFVASLKDTTLSELTQRPHEKAWNALEVLEHLSIAYSLYHSKIEKALRESPDSQKTVWEYRPGFWNRFVIEGQRPKGAKRSFKIKTLKKFEPLLPQKITQKDVDAVFERFQMSHNKLKEFILESRTKKMKHKRFTSAIGPIISFHLPEAFEFLICHAERHKVQIEEILASQT